MALTPVDIMHTEFNAAFKGYNRPQVDAFVQSVRQALEDVLKEKSDLLRKIDALQDEVDRVRKIESAMSEALTVAQKSAEEVRLNAHRQAELIVQEAEQSRVKTVAEAQQEAGKYRADIALLQATRDRFEAEFKGMLSSYMEWLQKHSSEEEARSEVA
ncbi:MAG: DivIVA domain-containing protein [Armatimonadota bacterium]|nr:DivIVA domain-containing protein [bacterium]